VRVVHKNDNWLKITHVVTKLSEPHNKNKEKDMAISINPHNPYLQNQSLRSMRLSRKHFNKHRQNVSQNPKNIELDRIRKMQDSVNRELADSVFTEFFKELFGKKTIV